MSDGARRIGTLIWALIFGGLFVVGMGVALDRSGESYSWIFLALGMAGVAAGCILVWVRSRMPEP